MFWSLTTPHSIYGFWNGNSTPAASRCRPPNDIARWRPIERRDRGGSAALSSVCQRLGLGRQRERHDALHDAWLAMQVYLWLQKSPLYKTPFSVVAGPGFGNLREIPPKPEGPLPRRRARPRAKAAAE
jgi:hypothetical protein